MSKIEFGLMEEKDIDDVLFIEQATFPSPWTREAFEQEVNNKFAKYVLIKVDGRIVGYCGLWIVFDEAQVTNVAILPEYRGQKLGEALFTMAIELVKTLGAKTMSLEVRVSNDIAQRMYRKFGFQDGGIRKRYYQDNLEDALVMWVKFNE